MPSKKKKLEELSSEGEESSGSNNPDTGRKEKVAPKINIKPLDGAKKSKTKKKVSDKKANFEDYIDDYIEDLGNDSSDDGSIINTPRDSIHSSKRKKQIITQRVDLKQAKTLA